MKRMRKKFKINQIFHTLIAYLSAIKYPKNFLYCCKYPFMKRYNVWTRQFMGYQFTMLDDMPLGWRKAFGQEMVQELKQSLKKTHSKIYWAQIKEKWGQLCLYASANKETMEILTKYEIMSIGYCIECGKPARYCTDGYVRYLCTECFDQQKVDFSDLHKFNGYKNHCRLRMRDIPQGRIYNPETQQGEDVDYQKQYGLNFMQMWDIHPRQKNKNNEDIVDKDL